MASAYESLESAGHRLSDAADDLREATGLLDDVAPRLSADAHRAATQVADMHTAVRRAAEALEGVGAR